MVAHICNKAKREGLALARELIPFFCLVYDQAIRPMRRNTYQSNKALTDLPKHSIINRLVYVQRTGQADR